MGTVSIVILTFISYCFATCKSDELRLLLDNAVHDKILSGAVFEVFSKTSMLQCRRLCLYSSRCVSANWITGAKECQLNSRRGEERSSQDSHSNIYLDVHVNPLQAHPCSDRPCTAEDICIPVTGSTSHICLRTDSSDQGASSVLSITTAGNPGVSNEAFTTQSDQAIVQTSGTSTTANNNLVQTSDTSTTTNNNRVQTSGSSTTANNNLVQTSGSSTTPNNILVRTSGSSTTANNNLVQTSGSSTTANNILVQASNSSTTTNNNLVQTSDTSTTTNNNRVQTSGSSTTANNNHVQANDSSATTNNNLVQTSDTSTTANNNHVQASDASTTTNNNLVQTSASSTTANNNLVQTSDTSTTANNNLVQTSDTSTTASNNPVQASDTSTKSTADGSCSGDAECVAFPSTKCRDGFCTCSIGYDLDVARAVCRDLRECATFGTEYIHFPGQVIWREDVESKFSSYPVAKCVQLCNEASTYVCKTFEIDTKLTGCYTQSVTWLDVTEDKYVYLDRYDQYQRKCNWGIK